MIDANLSALIKACGVCIEWAKRIVPSGPAGTREGSLPAVRVDGSVETQLNLYSNQSRFSPNLYSNQLRFSPNLYSNQKREGQAGSGCDP
jgi:hypothetical protein